MDCLKKSFQFTEKCSEAHKIKLHRNDQHLSNCFCLLVHRDNDTENLLLHGHHRSLLFYGDFLSAIPVLEFTMNDYELECSFNKIVVKAA